MGLGGVAILYQRARRGQEAILEGKEELGGTFSEPGGIGRARRCWEALPESQEGSGGLS